MIIVYSMFNIMLVRTLPTSQYKVYNISIHDTGYFIYFKCLLLAILLSLNITTPNPIGPH